MKILILLLVIFESQRVESTIIFTLHHGDNETDWATAKSRCEALGHRLAVLDTVEKRDALQAQISSSGYPWIGSRDVDNNDEFVWLNGNVLADDDTNWRDGNPDHGENNCVYISLNSWGYGDSSCARTDAYICERNDLALTFTLHDEKVEWGVAKIRCESQEQRLAVLDEAYKLRVVKAQGISGSGPWIGFHDPGENNTFYWLNGNRLLSNDPNWKSGEKYEWYFGHFGERR